MLSAFISILYLLEMEIFKTPLDFFEQFQVPYAYISLSWKQTTNKFADPSIDLHVQVERFF